MYAYCNNNPIIAADHNGEWLNVVIGAVVGGAVSAVTTWLQGGTIEEIAVSGVCGAVSGAFAATGFGSIVGHMAVGAITSAVDSGFQNYGDVKKGNASASQAVVRTLVDATFGALLGAVGYDGGDALKVSKKITNEAIDAVRTLKNTGLHPKVKTVAKKAFQAAVKYAKNEFISSAIDNSAWAAVGVGIGKFTELVS